MTTSPSTDNYTLGKGIVYFNRYDFANSEYTGERDLGNAPSFTFNIAIEKLEHYSSRGGLRAKDKEIISQITPGVAFTLDEVNADNLALLTLADIASVTQSSDTVTDEVVVAKLGKRIDLANREISSVVVGDDATPTITYVEGPATNPLANYQIDTSLNDDHIGRILIHADQSGAASAITEDQDLYVDYDAAAVTYTEVRSFAQTQTEGFLRFVSDNPAGGQQELQIWRVSLTPTGDTAMIGDDWSTLAFTGEILKDETGHPNSPYMSILMNSVVT